VIAGTMESDLQNADRGRAEEFLELYAACERKLYVYIVALIGNSLEAHDILQDTVLILWRKYDQFERGASFLAWARGVARYRVLRYRQMHANEACVLEPKALDAVAARLDRLDDPRQMLYAEALPGCIEQLGDRDRELLHVRYAGDISLRSLAAKLNRSENALSQSLGRIRRLLRKCVEETVRRRTNEEGPRG
jgi:RNA polymerase sigma-70 factor, ECF subfamily